MNTTTDTSITPAQATAQKLVEQWEEKADELRKRFVATEYEFAKANFTADAIERCRRELQAAFGLGSLGSAPLRRPVARTALLWAAFGLGSLGSAPQPPSDSESSSA